MRARLIAVGAAIASIGAAVIVAVTIPVSSPHDTHTGSVAVSQLHPGGSSWVPLNVTSANRGVVSFSWTATQRANVEWWAAVSCSTSPLTWCVTGEPLRTWFNATSGQWTAKGPIVAIYSVQVNDTTNQSLNFAGEFHEDISDTNGLLPMLPLAVSIAGGALLIGMGGIATYLGLFLPSGVFSEPLDDEELEPFALDGGAAVGEPPHGHSGRPPSQ